MSSLPALIDKCLGGELLVRILEMPERKPISLGEAICIISVKKMEAFKASDIGTKPGQYVWYTFYFVNYISDLGYHIELTGDEFENLCSTAEIRA